MQAGAAGLAMIGAGSALVAGAALYLGGVIGPAAPPGEKAAQEPAARTAPAAPQKAAPDRGADEAEGPPEVATSGDRAEDAAPARIDLFRLQPDGEALVAGQGAPGRAVEILLDGVVLATQTPGGDGSFAAFLTLPEASTPRVLTLRSPDPEGGAPADGAQQIVIAPRTRDKAQAEPPAAQMPSKTPAASSASEMEVAIATAPAKDAPAPAASSGATPEATAAVTDADAVQPVGASEPEPDAGGPASTDSQPSPATEPPRTQAGDAPADQADAATPLAATEPAPDGSMPASPGAPAAQPQKLRRLTQADTPPPRTADTPRGGLPDGGGDDAAPTVATSSDLAAAPKGAAPQVVLMADAEGAQVLSTPSSTGAPRAMSDVAIDTISYSDDGDVQLAGRATGQGTVRIYLDNRPVTASRIAEGGRWRTNLPKVDTGVYTLRVDELDEAGRVVSRAETPFKREDRDLLAELQDEAIPDTPGADTAPAGDIGTPIRAITVQPGNTLWAISRETYGEGILYVRVFEANADRIRDPDLIYPGQVFSLPE